MRSLLPPSEHVHLVDAYAYPEGKPWLRANLVTSLDGAYAFDERSDPLSGRADRRLLVLLRDLSDAVLVGAETARMEGYAAIKRTDARVQWRRERGLSDVPPLVVVTKSLVLDPESPLFVNAAARTIVVTTQQAAERRGRPLADVADVIATPGNNVDLAVALQALQERGLTRLLCEGGPMLLSELVRSGCLDELCLTVSPMLVGGEDVGLLSRAFLPRPKSLRLAHVLEDEGFLFTRYVGRAG